MFFCLFFLYFVVVVVVVVVVDTSDDREDGDEDGPGDVAFGRAGVRGASILVVAQQHTETGIHV